MSGELRWAAWLTEPLPTEVRAALERVRASDDVQAMAVMPDVHLAADVCIGTVMATSRLVYPNAVGGDIGCGMTAVALEAQAEVLSSRETAGRLLARLPEAVPVHRHRQRQSLPDELLEATLSIGSLETMKRRDAAVQLGTLGRGNHFLEVQADESDRLWLLVHSGSRAIGQAVRDAHLRAARVSGSGLKFLDVETDAGQAYIADARWAEAYARASRRRMLEATAELFASLFGVGVLEDSWLDTSHNHLRREMHEGRSLWVHRKGAASARAGEAVVIPGSMNSASFHVSGRGCAAALRSCSHGAGRAMSRDAARRRISASEVHRQLRGVWFDARAAGRLRDEAPAAYKDIHAVMRAQGELVRIERRLRAVLSYKGG